MSNNEDSKVVSNNKEVHSAKHVCNDVQQYNLNEKELSNQQEGGHITTEQVGIGNLVKENI